MRQAKEAKKVENVAAHVKEMEEARLAKQARKAANINMAREAKQAKDARRAQHIKKAEEAKSKKETKEMAQWNSLAPGEDLEDLSDGFEGMEDIEAAAGEESDFSIWLEAIKQQHRHIEGLPDSLGRHV